MGSVNKITCTACGKEWQCMTGCGLSHALLKDAAKAFPEETGKEIIRQCATEEFPIFAFAYQRAVCPECHGIVSVPVLRLPDKNREYIGNCPDCMGAVVLIEDLDDAACPVCGSKTLHEEETGYWD